MTTLSNFDKVQARLRKMNRSRYALLLFCTFFSVTLVTAYSLMMYSPTVLDVLPEGGDSRKQTTMIFVLTILGCAVFTTYAAGLFFREKSRETGIFLALGASRSQLSRALYKELALIALGSCIGGGLLGIGVAAGIWQIFRAVIVDTAEMALHFDLKAYAYVLAFALFVTVMLFFLGRRSVRGTNIIDVIQESHKSEPIRAVPRWYGPAGIILVAAGAALGYFMPSFFILRMHWYPPGIVDAICYAPALIGLYMILLHTVANGWGGKRKRYKGIISVSMMKFQARQTVRNMLVMTLLIAGAYFASFYMPMMMGSADAGARALPIDYLFHYRADQHEIPDESAIRALADEYDVTIESYAEAPMARLAVDGMYSVETETAFGTTYEKFYTKQFQSNLFLSESGYEALSGAAVDVEPGTIVPVYNSDGFDNYQLSEDVTIVTNFVTGEEYPVTVAAPFINDSLLGYYVLDDNDYARWSAGLPPEWLENLVAFNVADVDDTYAFADALFNAIVDGSGPEVELIDAWDPVIRARDIAADGSYWCDPENAAEYDFEGINYDNRDGTDFRSDWLYMPAFRVLNDADLLQTYAVFMMIFVFIAIVCFAAVFVIAYTRCLTIALTNRSVYDDLRHLGAPPDYLHHSATSQVRRVFLTPALFGTIVISAFYCMMMYFNDNQLTAGECYGLGLCGLVIAAVSALLWVVYRMTRRKVCSVLSLR